MNSASRLRVIAPPVLLSVLSLAAVLWWIMTVVVAPRNIRLSLEEKLTEYFHGGVRIARAEKIAPSIFCAWNLRAFAPRTQRHWIEVRRAVFLLAPGNERLSEIRLVRPIFLLNPAPDYVPAGAVKLDSGRDGVPRIKGEAGRILGPAGNPPEAGSPWAEDLRLAFYAAESNGGGPPVYRGDVSAGRVSLPGAEIEMTDARGQVEGVGGAESLRPLLRLRSAVATWRGIGFSGVILSIPLGVEGEWSGSAKLWDGAFHVRGRMGGVFSAEGGLRGADASLMPPGWLGAVTPASGQFDMDFSVSREKISGDFICRDAGLWTVPFLAGIKTILRSAGLGVEGFRKVTGKFERAGDVMLLPELEFEGTGYVLSLCGPGRVGPARRLDLLFEIHFRGGGSEGGIEPIRKLVGALKESLWRPIEKVMSPRIRVQGTLDAPEHKLAVPEIFDK